MATENKQTPRDPDETRRLKAEQARRNRRRTRQLIGLALAVLIVVGAISIVRSGVQLVQSWMDNTSEIDEYNAKLAPLVWFDPLPFEALGDADLATVKQAMIWGTLNQIGYNNVEHTERDEALVPAIEVDRYAAALFGPEYVLEHESFQGMYRNMEDIYYEYDEATAMYILPATGFTPEYMCNVVEIERVNSSVRRVTVGYVSTIGTGDELIATLDLDHAAKYMDYFFRRDGNEYFLYALRSNTSYVPPEASSTEESQPAEEPSSVAASVAASAASAAQ